MVSMTTSPSTRFTVSVTGTAQIAPSAPARTAATAAAHNAPAGERSSGVVDHDDLRVGRHRRQPGTHRGRAGRPTGDGHAPVRRPPAHVPGGRTTTTPAQTDRAAATRPFEHRPPAQALILLRPAVPAAGPGGDDDRPHPVGSLGRVHPRPAYGRASFSFFSASSSLTPMAKVSSETRIWRARVSMRFSPADRPLSFSRMDRFRTTSATW